MKKRLLLLFAIPFLFLACSDGGSSSGGPTSVSEVTLDKDILELTVGKTVTLNAAVAPPKAANKAVTWTTSNAAVATVNAGTVKAVSDGAAIITATAKDGSGKKAECTVTVSLRPVFAIGAKDSLSGKTAQEYINDNHIYIGWNLGNAFDAPSETAWNSIAPSQNMMDGLKASGFSMIRIPVRWDSPNHPMGSAPGYEIQAAYLNRVAAVVDMAYNAGLVTIINIHHDGSGRDSWLSVYHAALDVAGNEDRTYNSITAKFTKIWEQVAAKFQNYGDWLIFEPFNELHNGGWGWGNINPREFEVINEWNQIFTDTVRAGGGKNTERFLVVQPYCAKPHQALNPVFELPTDTATNKQIVSIHYYDPEAFALNGGVGTWSDYARIDTDFGNFRNAFTAKGIPVIIGECGATAQAARTGAEKTAADAARLAYLDYLCSQARASEMIPIFWDNGSVDSRRNDENFGIINRINGQPLAASVEVVETMINAVN